MYFITCDWGFTLLHLLEHKAKLKQYDTLGKADQTQNQ